MADASLPPAAPLEAPAAPGTIALSVHTPESAAAIAALPAQTVSALGGSDSESHVGAAAQDCVVVLN